MYKRGFLLDIHKVCSFKNNLKVFLIALYFFFVSLCNFAFLSTVLCTNYPMQKKKVSLPTPIKLTAQSAI